MKYSPIAGKRKLLLTASAMAMALSFQSAYGNEFLFGYSGGEPNFLVLDGSTELSTGTSLLGPSHNQGWWSAANGNSDDNDNWFVGDLGGPILNNFFTFDISGLIDPVSSVALKVKRAGGQSDLGATSHTYNVYDVSTDAATLNANNGTSAAIAGDLGSGTQYGSFVISVSGNFNEYLLLGLNSAAIADLNAAIAGNDQYFSVGGSLIPGGAPAPDAGSTMMLLGLSVVGLAAFRRKSAAA